MTAPKKVDAGKLRAEILAGRHDDDLKSLVETIRERVDGEARLAWRWKISLDGDSWTEETVTLAEVQIVERITGKSWLALNPAVSSVHLAAYMLAHLVRGGVGEDEARERVDSMTVMSAAAAVDRYVTTSAPKDDPGTSTKP